MARITAEPGGEAFDCGPGDTILRAALRAGLGMSYSCNTGSCGNCRFELLEGAVVHRRADAPAWGERDLKRNRWLGCQAVPEGDCRIKFRADDAAVCRDRPMKRQGRLVSAERITHDITEFGFEVEGPDGFRPGQYALVYAPVVDGGRPYSMSNLPGQGIWRFMVKRVPGGAVTGHLFDGAKPGDNLALDGPYGTAWLREDSPRDLLLIAGGSGLSPMVSIARAAAESAVISSRRLHFFYGCRTEADLVDPALLSFLPKGSLTQALSEPGPGWDGKAGFLHEVVEAALGPELPGFEVYFAGPAAMSPAIQKMAHEAGLPRGQLHFDEFY